MLLTYKAKVSYLQKWKKLACFLNRLSKQSEGNEKEKGLIESNKHRVVKSWSNGLFNKALVVIHTLMLS